MTNKPCKYTVAKLIVRIADNLSSKENHLYSSLSLTTCTAVHVVALKFFLPLASLDFNSFYLVIRVAWALTKIIFFVNITISTGRKMLYVISQLYM